VYLTSTSDCVWKIEFVPIRQQLRLCFYYEVVVEDGDRYGVLGSLCMEAIKCFGLEH
jgi:hypothetical protein